MNHFYVWIIVIVIFVLIIVFGLRRVAEIFYPDEYLDGTYSIDFEMLYNEGYRALIFDIDNTLVEHGFPADDRSKALLTRLNEMGFSITFLSNNKEPRVKSFRDAALPCANYIYKAGKPGRKGYQKAMQIMNTSSDNTVFIGDQLFTDVWGAKRCGIKNILVAPIDPHEEIQIILKRRLEWIVLCYYEKAGKSKEKPHDLIKNS